MEENTVLVNYTIFKKEMRKFLKQTRSPEYQKVLNNNLQSMNQNLQEINNNQYNLELHAKLEKVQLQCLPYMLGYWMLTEPFPTDVIA